jgi:hypothetical protein
MVVDVYSQLSTLINQEQTTHCMSVSADTIKNVTFKKHKTLN